MLGNKAHVMGCLQRIERKNAPLPYTEVLCPHLLNINKLYCLAAQYLQYLQKSNKLIQLLNIPSTNY